MTVFVPTTIESIVKASTPYSGNASSLTDNVYKLISQGFSAAGNFRLSKAAWMVSALPLFLIASASTFAEFLANTVAVASVGAE